MNKIIPGTVLLILNFIWCTSAQYEGAYCVTPNNEVAFCVSLANCPLLTAALSTNSNDIQQMFLRHSICGYPDPYLGSIPLVCCGSASNYEKIYHQYGKNLITENSVRTTLKPTTEAPMSQSINTGKIYLEKLLPSRSICGRSEDSSKIIGGTEAAIGEFPWMAQLFYRDSTGQVIEFYNFCGGSLISKNYVLTAAHCIVGAIEKQVGKIHGVRLGEHDTTKKIDCYEDEGCNEEVVDVLVVEIITHEGYLARRNNRNRHHDIGLLRLAQNIVFTDFISPICLPLNGESVMEGQMVFTAGWGGLDPNATMPSIVKMKLNTSISDQSQCYELYRIKYNVTLAQSQLCAGGDAGRDSCGGDSGGPLMAFIPRSVIWYLEGLVSFGSTPCGKAGIPAIYTKVSSYLDWIAEKIRP